MWEPTILMEEWADVTTPGDDDANFRSLTIKSYAACAPATDVFADISRFLAL